MPAVTQDQSLDVIIVGAGIAGLAAGISLRRAGHNVRIFERSELNNEVGAAIHVPPNANRSLVAWGLDPVENKFVASTGIAIGSGATLQQFDFTPLGDWVPKVFGGPLYFAHRVDLHESLKKLALGPEGPGKPVELNLGVHVVAYVSNMQNVEMKQPAPYSLTHPHKFVMPGTVARSHRDSGIRDGLMLTISPL